MATKICTRCGLDLPLDSYYQKSLDSTDGQRYKTPYGRAMQPCRECRKKRANSSRATPERKLQIRSWNLKKNYGISLDQYDEMLSAQGGVCAICGDPPCGNYSQLYLQVDHCHTTGRVRGLLCGPCNLGLGSLKDSPKLLRLAAEYLEG
jgi:hypothetical protein